MSGIHNSRIKNEISLKQEISIPQLQLEYLHSPVKKVVSYSLTCFICKIIFV